jgi:nucleoside-diphosphate-sugar epimerase
MTILVTGGAGSIASHMVLALAGAGERVVVLDNLSPRACPATVPQAKVPAPEVARNSGLPSIGSLINTRRHRD